MIKPYVLPAFQLFQDQQVVYDRTTTATRGRATHVRGSNRNVAADVQYATDKDLQFAPEGLRTDGALIVKTKAAIYVTDSSDTTRGRRQTFLIYDGEVWRFHALTNSALNAQGVRRYLATKYVDPD